MSPRNGDLQLSPVAPRREESARTHRTGKVSGSRKFQNDQDREPPLLLLSCLAGVNFLEGADKQLIPAATFALQKDINLTLTDIAMFTTAQLVVSSLAGPFWGALADRGTLKRKQILMIGSLGEGIAVILIAFIRTKIWPMILLRALSGFFLASLRPVCNGIIADATSENRRGRVCGRVLSSNLFGMFICGVIAGNIANISIVGIEGWRVCVACIGIVAAMVAIFISVWMAEPYVEARVENSTGCQAVLQEILSVFRFLSLPTFLIMVLQGIFGTLPWVVLGNSQLYFQLTGLEVWEATILTSEIIFMGIFGNLVGGQISDYLAIKFGYHGRPLSAQITVAAGIPLIFLLFWGVPAGQGTFAEYFLIIAAFGLFGSWAQSGTNFPILMDIALPKDRSKVMAWEFALENSIASTIGPILVTMLAEKSFGYKFGDAEIDGDSLHSASALGKAMTVTICFPWLVTLAAYSLLHWSYPRDIRMLQEKRAQRAARAYAKRIEAMATTPISPRSFR